MKWLIGCSLPTALQVALCILDRTALQQDVRPNALGRVNEVFCLPVASFSTCYAGERYASPHQTYLQFR